MTVAEALEGRMLLAVSPIISEFMAMNLSGLMDQDHDRSDWIEIFNPGPTSLNLEGYYLTDDAQTLNKWRFPSVNVPTQGYVTVFASEKDRHVAGQELHTNFKLTEAGEYLGLVAPDGLTVVSEYAPQYPQQIADVSYGVEVSNNITSPVSTAAGVKVLVPSDNSLGTSWRELDLDDSTWREGTTGVGYETTTTYYGGLIATDVKNAMLGVNASAYMRIRFTLTDEPDWLKLRMKYDDGFVAYINGSRVASRNAPDTAQWNSTATGIHLPSSAVVYEDFTTVPAVGLLHEGENVLAIQGLNITAGDSDFLVYPELQAVQVDATTQRYFRTPTPGGANSMGEQIEFVADTKFDYNRGFCDSPFNVTITTETEGATIRYTRDGSAPTATTGTAYTGPVPIATTTLLRAAAFKPGWVSTNVDTQTYIFLNDVVHQPTNPAGFPAMWNGLASSVAANYEVDPNVVNDPAYSSTIINDLKSIPTISLVANVNDIFGTNGLYTNPGQQYRGATWERPASAELIYADGSEGFQIDAGLRMYGGVGSEPTASLKHTFRLLFKEKYGAGKLKYPLFKDALFGDTAVDEFDTVILRAGFNNSYPLGQGGATYLQDAFSAATQWAMGQVASHNSFVHLYVNGLYWGLYNPAERPSAPFLASYFGGLSGQYDALNSGEAIDGDKSAWNTMHNIANAGLSTQAAYDSIKQYLDVDNLIDYMLMNFYGGNWDWDSHNWYAGRKRETGAGYKFFNWDGEGNLENTTVDITNMNNSGCPSRLYTQLRANAEFRLLFADHVQRHFFDDGTLTPTQAANRWIALCNQIDRAIVGESARWGDTRREPPFNRNTDWINRKNWQLNSYFPVRTANVLAQLKADGLYPSVAAPSFNQHGGVISSGFNLTISAPTGTIYYTLDGTDPRVQGGGVSGTARTYSGAVPLDKTTTVKARVLSGTTWSALEEAKFVYDLSTLRVTELMYNPPEPEGSDYVAQDFEYVELQNTGTTPLNASGVRFTRGIDYTFPTPTTLSAGARVVLAKNRVAFQSRYPGVAVFGQYDGYFDNAGQRVALSGSDGTGILDFTYNNNWYAITDGGGYSLVVVSTAAPESAFSDKSNWRPSNLPDGGPGAADPGINPNTVVINEVVPNTEHATGTWIELRNTSAGTIDISGWFLSDDPVNLTKYRIPTGKTISANGYMVFTQVSTYGSALDLGKAGGVYLSNTDGAGHVAGYRDCMSLDPSDKEVPVARYIKSTGTADYTPMTAQTIGAANTAAPLVGPVVINELMYHPVGSNDEFVELKNITGSTAPLYDAAHPENTWKFTSGITFSFPSAAEIGPYGYALVVPTAPADFRAKYNIPGEVPIYGPYTGALNNGGENVRLSRPAAPDGQGQVAYVLVDRVDYDNEAPWPIAPDGHGPSLGRISLTAYGNDPVNWSAGSPGGTPGAPNGQEAPVVDLAADVVLTAGNTFNRVASFGDANAGQTWTATIKWDNGTPQSLALNPDKTFTLSRLYSTPGTFTVTVTVTDSLGAVGSDKLTISVVPNGPRQGSSSGDIYTLRLDATGTYTQFFENIPTTGNPTFYVDRSVLGPVSINGNGGNDQVRIDLIYGSPVPPAGLTFSGGDGSDLIQIIGTAGSEQVSAGGNHVSFGGSVITFDTLERLQVDGRDGDDSLTITAALPFTPVFNGGTGANAGNDTLTVLGGTYDYNSDLQGGTAKLTMIVAGTGTVNLNAAQHLVSLTANGSGTVNFNVTQQLFAPLILAENGRAVIAPGGNKVLRLSSLTIMDNGALDLTDNDLILTHSDGDHGLGKLAQTSNLIGQALNMSGGYWDGSGITSSTARDDPAYLTGLGILNNDDGSGNAIYTAFSGQAVDQNAILVKYTYYGDNNLDGVVDLDTDFSLFVDGFNGAGAKSGWLYGDYNYDGLIDLDTDFSLFVGAYNNQGGGLGEAAPAKAAASLPIQPKNAAQVKAGEQKPASRRSRPTAGKREHVQSPHSRHHGRARRPDGA